MKPKPSNWDSSSFVLGVEGRGSHTSSGRSDRKSLGDGAQDAARRTGPACAWRWASWEPRVVSLWLLGPCHHMWLSTSLRGLQRRRRREERVFFVRVHRLRNKPATNIRAMHISFFHVNPPGPIGSSPRPPPALRHRNLFPTLPNFAVNAHSSSLATWTGLAGALAR